MKRLPVLALLAATSCVATTSSTGTTTSQPVPTDGAPAAAASPTDYRGRLNAIAPTSPRALDDLAALRVDIMTAYLRERAGVKFYSKGELMNIGQTKGPDELRKATAPAKQFEAQWADTIEVLRALKARRAAVWAAQGDAFAALAEYAWPRGWGLGEEVLPNCYDKGEECKTVVKAVRTEFGRLPPVFTEQAASVIDSVDTDVERFALVDVNVRAVAPSGKGYVVSGLSYGPGKTRSCHGFYQTNEITNVTATTITITQTDWCKKITIDPSLGVDLRYEVDSPVPVTAKTQLRLLVDKNAVKCTNDKSMRRCQFKNTRLVAVNNGEQAVAGNQQLASAQLLLH